MNKPRKEVTPFASEAEERAFWESHDSTDDVDWPMVQRTLPMRTDRDPGAEAARELEAYYRRL